MVVHQIAEWVTLFAVKKKINPKYNTYEFKTSYRLI